MSAPSDLENFTLLSLYTLRRPNGATGSVTRRKRGAAHLVFGAIDRKKDSVQVWRWGGDGLCHVFVGFQGEGTFLPHSPQILLIKMSPASACTSALMAVLPSS